MKLILQTSSLLVIFSVLAKGYLHLVDCQHEHVAAVLRPQRLHTGQLPSFVPRYQAAVEQLIS